MRWYFAIDEAGANGATGEDAKTALGCAMQLGGLEPRLLYHGARNDFTAWMEAHGVAVIDAAPKFLDCIRDAEAAGRYRAHSIGHWLRLVIPEVEQERDFVLYTDCDVLFLKRVDWAAIRPKVFAAAPEFKRDNWNYFNAGVMVLNVPAMRVSYPALETAIRERISSGEFLHYDDELALNEVYRGFWEQLDPQLNWKPYWGFNAAAAILHFHGPKLGLIEAVAGGAWHPGNPAGTQLATMIDAHIPAYAGWLNHLGDRLQASDLGLALRMQNAASALLRHGRGRAAPDTEFMNFRMFPE